MRGNYLAGTSRSYRRAEFMGGTAFPIGKDR
jgi:hypothetical protein